jgi:hypothetical protein
MKFIKQISTGKSVYRENPHSDKTISNAVSSIGIALSDLEVADEVLTEQQWSDKANDDLSWEEKMARSDNDMMSRTMEDMLDGMADKSGVAKITLDRLQAKKDLRATKP